MIELWYSKDYRGFVFDFVSHVIARHEACKKLKVDYFKVIFPEVWMKCFAKNEWSMKMKEKIKNNCVWKKSFHLSPFTFHSKKAFTLSELMVVMVVLGVLASIAIPAVMKVKPSQNRVMFKKAYSTMEKAVSVLSNDDVAYPADKVVTAGDCTGVAGESCGFAYTTATAGIPIGPPIPNKFCYLLSQVVNTAGDAVCIAQSGGVTHIFDTPDGIAWYYKYASVFTADPDPTKYSWIGVDVNGGDGPNCAETTDYFVTSSNSGTLAKCPAPDRFAIGIRYDGKLTVAGTVGPDILANPTVNNKPDGKAY